MEDLERLLQAIYATVEILETPKEALVQDKLYRGLNKGHSRALPLHQSLKDLILLESEDSKDQKTWKRRFPFKKIQNIFFVALQGRINRQKETQ